MAYLFRASIGFGRLTSKIELVSEWILHRIPKRIKEKYKNKRLYGIHKFQMEKQRLTRAILEKRFRFVDSIRRQRLASFP